MSGVNRNDWRVEGTGIAFFTAFNQGVVTVVIG